MTDQESDDYQECKSDDSLEYGERVTIVSTLKLAVNKASSLGKVFLITPLYSCLKVLIGSAFAAIWALLMRVNPTIRTDPSKARIKIIGLIDAL